MILALAACDGGVESAEEAATEGRPGWSIDASGDLNDFFDCLEKTGKTLVAAHRGGPAPGFPENAIETFENTMAQAPAFLEIDIATSSDGVLYLMHDDTLERTTNGAGAIESVAWKDVSALRLEDSMGRATPYHPPSFAEALSWAKGRTILEIDIKKSTRYEDVIAEINRQQAEDRVILIAYTTAQARRLHRLSPRIMISLSVSTQSDLNNAVAAGVPADRLLGFTGVEEPKPRLFSMLDAQDIEVVFGTLGGRDSIDQEIEISGDEAHYAALAAMGVDIIATDRPLAAQEALEKAGRGAVAGACGINRR
ncbi:MAG TPA: glycerophosphodiester phosphodiesterase family protein [Parvularculaceae bacterium]|nr:glycerophosphodiester phosphodiesterase family protein [Parvularculaceae bacterium]